MSGVWDPATRVREGRRGDSHVPHAAGQGRGVVVDKHSADVESTNRVRTYVLSFSLNVSHVLISVE